MEIIKYACPIILFIFSILAIVFAVIILWSEERKDTENKLLIVFCFSSAIWSIGFGALILQTEAEWAYRCRVFGMIGTILYLITGQMLISYLSGIKKRWTNLFNGFAGLGIFVYFLTVERSQTIYQLDASGMTYSFKAGPANTIYTAYSLILAVIMFCISLYMCFSKVKRVRFFGKIFMVTVAAMLLGTILDTVLPLLGFRAIPGSTLTQFLGMVVAYIAIRANNRSKINIANMSEFIYYSLSMPVLVYNSGKRLQLANDAAAKFFEIDRNLISQKNISLGMLFDKGDDAVFEFEGNSRNIDSSCIQNQIYCNLAINKIQDRYNDVIGYIIIVTDLSERVKTLQRLEEAKQEAEAANHSKTAFLANMSHEIRTPMNAILGFSELILKKDISDTVREYASDIKTSCLNLLTVINDILDISKLDSGKAELSCGNYHTAFLLQEVYHIIDLQARKKGLYFEMNTDPRIPNELYGDMTRVRGILINLLNNAVKYTEHGSVVFNIRLLGMDEKTATLEYTVTDTGIGLEESAMRHLFDSFARFDTKRNTNIEGTGLGLSIVNGYVNLMGGTIKVDSIYGRGTTFTVTLNQDIVDASPLIFNKTTAGDINSLNGIEIEIQNTRVLVTDDNRINLKVIKNTLEHYGLTVETAASGAEAIQLCEKTQYDLIFMDQMMPGMDGIETMKRIRTLSTHYEVGAPGKIIVLTANAILGVRNELMEKGFDEYLSKPIQFQELERVLRQFIPESKFLSGERSVMGEKSVQVMSGEQQRRLSQEPSAASEKKEDVNKNLSEKNYLNVSGDIVKSMFKDGTKDVFIDSSKASDTMLILEDLLPQINVTAGLANCNEDATFYLDILRILYDDADQQLENLQKFWMQKDYPNFIVLIHSLKTQLLNIGYVLLAEDAKALELAGKENRFEYIEGYLDAFVSSYKELKKQLEAVFATIKIANNKSEQKIK